ncbi:malonate--CoA ligase [Tianweitania sediminis]|uniref:Malonyl-CoA synthase n=1 Tax=Tianweitania sediminis TaxID=1502156 RepID=A0A8J7UMS7_9HYPH|nr:malonyl-CoA synthase [Tianweitania sediminis]MBP0440707.1 malonyl-CoA synthase [Tianweitania sediminis]
MNHLFDALFPAGRDLSKTCVTRPGGSIIDYAAIIEGSARYARALVQLRVGTGDRVAVQVDKSLEALLLYLACVRAGAVFLPLNTAYTSHEVGYFLRDAEPALFVGRPEAHEELAPVASSAGVQAIETLGRSGDGTLPSLMRNDGGIWQDVPRGADDLAAILYTSGTTGRSKGAMLTHENLRSNAAVLVETWRWTSEDILIHALPIFHAHGLFVASNVTLMAGAAMIFLPKFEPAEVLRWMPQATAMMGVPTFYTRLLAEDRLDRDVASRMRVFISGSAPLLAETHEAFKDRTGHAILERYGMTETSMNTSNPYDGARLPGSVGLPLKGTSVRVAEPETGEILGTNEIGVIELKGPNVFKGYWQMPEKTASEFRADGWFITGDLGKIDEAGYVWILGRAKDLVISGGYNVYPKEVEEELDLLDGVAESAVIGIPHPDFGEAVVAVVVPERGRTVAETELIAALRQKIAAYKLPKRVVVVEELPRNTMAKVQKNLLREDLQHLFAS